MAIIEGISRVIDDEIGVVEVYKPREGTN